MSEEQQNQSTGIVGEIVEKVETAVEHLIHGDGAPSSSEPVQEAGGATAGEHVPSTGLASESPVAVDAASLDAHVADSTAVTDAPAVAAAGEVGAAGSGAATNATDAASLSAQTSPSSEVSDAETTGASDDPNAAAPTAGDSSASDTQSSASSVSQVGVGLAIAASVSEAVASRVYTLRKHFWTFDEVTRAPFIKLLDEIEALVK
ncbi:hypothetical protein ACTJLD_30350 [Burkholderia sp. 22088]|uniref:hypothetical protein n=1 Tax=Burkholderia sp. 22088 TaxID=3453871 RepID=UPI003F859A05